MAVRKNTRITLFVLCTIIFIVAGTYAILAMQGLVFDINHFKFTKSGSIYINFTPTNGTVFINGKLYNKKQGLFGGGILISNLVPKTYALRVEKPGYTPWIKNLEVLPGKVSVAARITLWKPIELVSQSTSSVSAFFATEKGFVFKTTSSSLQFEDTVIRGSNVSVYDISSPYIFTTSGKNTILLIDLNNPTVARDFRVLFKTILSGSDITDTTPIQKIIFHPFSKTKCIVETTDSIYIYDIKRNSIEEIDTETSPKAMGVSANELFLVNKGGDIIIKNLLLGSQSLFPLNASSTKNIEPSRDGNFAFITKTDGTLLLFDRSAQTLKSVSDNVVFTSFGPDSLRGIFIDTENRAHIIYIDDYEGDTIKDQGTIESFVLPSESDASSFVWIPFAENYGMIQVGDEFKTLELDIRNPHNTTTIIKNARTASLIHGDLFVINTNNNFLKGTLEE